MEGARDHGDVLRGRVPVWHDAVPVGHLQAYRVGAQEQESRSGPPATASILVGFRPDAAKISLCPGDGPLPRIVRESLDGSESKVTSGLHSILRKILASLTGGDSTSRSVTGVHQSRRS